MKGTMKNKLNIYIICISFIMVMAVAMISLAAAKMTNYNALMAYEGKDRINITNEWENTSGRKVNITNTKYFNADGLTPYVYHQTLPEDIPENADFCFMTKNAGFAIFISDEDEKVISQIDYEAVTEENNIVSNAFKEALNKFTYHEAETYHLTKCISVANGLGTGIGARGMGSSLHSLHISKYAGQEIYVVLFPVYKSSKIGNLYLQNAQYYAQTCIQNTFIGFTMSLVIVIFANAILSMSMFMETTSKKTYMTLAAMMITVGLWSLLSSRTFDFVLGTSEFAYTMSYIILMIIPIHVALFADAFTYTEHKSVSAVIIPVAIANIVLSTISNYTGLWDFHDLTITTDVLILISVLVTAFHLANDIRFRKQYNFQTIHMATLVNLFILVACGLIDAARYMSILLIDSGEDNAYFTRIGLLIFSMTMLVDVYNGFVSQKKKANQAVAFKDIAFIDQLTGIENRAAFARCENQMEAKIKELSAKADDTTSIIYVSLDLNGLKQVNDTKGHAVGDVYIKTAARILKTSFQTADIFRIGGDEFAMFIVGKEAREDYEAGLRRMIRAENEYNKSANSGILMEFAYGMSEWKYFDMRDLHQVEVDADKAMYHKKREMKDEI